MTLRKHRQRFPDGLEHAHLSERGVPGRHASPVSVIPLGSFLAVALAALFRGGTRPAFNATSANATLSLKRHVAIHPGQYFTAQTATITTRPASSLNPALIHPPWH